MSAPSAPTKGRGATFNPANRFRSEQREAVDDGWSAPVGDAGGDDDPPPLKTVVRIQPARTIISRNDSPDIGFTQSINPYQGCEHGCIYCYARPTHAYLDLSPGLDFETKLFAKPNAAALLRAELAKPGYRCDPIALGTNTDPYQPIEREWKITRSVIEVLAECDHPLTITTKGALVERDIDLLAPMAAKGLVRVSISIAMLDRELARKLDPRAPSPQRRLALVKALAEAGVPVGVNVAPVIPQLTDSRARVDPRGGGGRRRALRCVDHAAPSARSRASLPRLARCPLSAARRARDEHRPANPRRTRQRAPLPRAHGRTRANSPISSASASRSPASGSASTAIAIRRSTRRASGRPLHPALPRSSTFSADSPHFQARPPEQKRSE